MRKRMAVILVIVIIAAVFVFSQIEFNRHHSGPSAVKTFTVEKGQGVSDIATNLKIQGFIGSPFWFEVYVYTHGERSRFVAGEFSLNQTDSIKSLAQTLTYSKNANLETDITIPEGRTVAEIDKYLFENNLIKVGDLIAYSSGARQVGYAFLGDRPRNSTLEGFLYPDSYRVYRQTTVDQIVRRMLDNFDGKLTPELRAEIRAQKKTIFDVVTMASIIEKEVVGYENRQIVAGIFWKRIKIGMALQSDATVNYITKKNVAAVSLDDTAIESLYNTYKYRGLPPGPICNPGIEAIKAAINPITTDYLYFLTTPDGRVIYSKTFDEHVANKNKYLK
ncbi:MAG: endolytic transglycosylase MltG [Parcubacteria group bacterium]